MNAPAIEKKRLTSHQHETMGAAIYWLLIGSIIAVVSFTLWSLDRGFNITDEAYYLLMAQHPEAVKFYISAQQWLTAPLWLLAKNMATFRFTGFLLLIGSASVLAVGVMALNEATLSRRAHFHIWASTCICALLYAATINLSPCYNLLASVGAYASAGLVFTAIARNGRWYSIGLFVLAGLALSAEFISKPSAGVATCGLLTLGIVLLLPSWKKKVTGIVALAFAMIIGIFVTARINTTLENLGDALQQGLQLFRIVQTESVVTRLLRYVVNFSHYLWEGLLFFLPSMLAAILYLRSGRQIHLIVFVSIFIARLLIGRFFLGGVDNYGHQVEAAFILTLLGMIISWPAWSKDKRTIVLVAGLALLPYTVAIGTGNPIFTQVIVSLASWGALLAILYQFKADTPYRAVIMSILFGAFIGTLTLQLLTSGLRAPYQLQTPLTGQSTPVQIAGVGLIKLDPKTASFIDGLASIRRTCDIQPGMAFWGLYNNLGVALPLEAIPVDTPWINNLAQADMILASSTNISSPFLLAVSINSDGTIPELPDKFADYAAHYRFCGEVVYPYGQQRIQVWRSPTL